jgi:MFS family permease
VASGLSFIVGVALFGAVTYLPLYLQDVKGHSPTVSGLLMTPMMAGVVITSIGSGQLISKFGRYKAFPIAGTAIAAVGLLLLSRLQVDTSPLMASADMLVLGLGLGFLMQVLVLAAQNAVDYKYLGVASSAPTLFRLMGGSIGVAIFGAVFANQLAGNLVRSLPPGVHVPAAASPTAVNNLPAAVHTLYVTAVTDAVHPVFFGSAGIMVLGFVLTWFLREIPLRGAAPASDLERGDQSPTGDAAA